jgi:hypothetical protein
LVIEGWAQWRKGAPMNNPGELYHQRAVECLLMSDEMADPHERETMRELAVSWLRLSERAEEYWRRASKRYPIAA